MLNCLGICPPPAPQITLPTMEDPKSWGSNFDYAIAATILTFLPLPTTAFPSFSGKSISLLPCFLKLSAAQNKQGTPPFPTTPSIHDFLHE